MTHRAFRAAHAACPSAWLIAFLGCALLAGGTPGRAQAQADSAAADGAPALGDLESLLSEEVVTTASRSAERASTAPATVSIIDGATLRRYGMRSVHEALGFLGLGSFVADSNRDYYTGVDTGFQGVLLRDRNRHVLVLIDGHVVNAQGTGETRLDVALGIPLELIDHIEVMLGPGSVSYGSNAMMAVINIVTLRARDYGRARVVAEGTLAAPVGVDSSISLGGGGDHYGGRYRLGAGFALTGRVAGHPAELLVHAEFQQEISATFEMALQNGVFDVRPGEPGWGGIARHRMLAPTAYLSGRIGDLRLWLQGSAYRRTMPLVGTFGEPDTRELLGTVRGELRHDANLSAEATLVSRLYGDHFRLDERSEWRLDYWCLPGQQLDGCNFRRRNASSWIGLEEQLNVDWKLDGRFVTTVGGDIRFRFAAARPADYRDRVTGDGPFTVQLPYWRSKSVIGALFVQQVLRVHDAVTLNAGARFDADSLFGVRLSPRAAIILQPAERTTLRLGYSQAFRAPSAQELRDSDPTYVVRPDRLSAEVVRTADLELAQRFARGSLSLRGFGSIYDGLLEQRYVTMAEFDAGLARGELTPNADPAGVTVWDNRNTIRVAGGTVSGRVEPIAGLELVTNLTLAVNEMRGVGPLPIIPAFYGNARVAYRIGSDGPTLALVGRFSSVRYASVQTEDGDYLPHGARAGALGELRLSVTGPVRALPGLTWRAFFNASLSARQPYLASFGPVESAPDNTFAFNPNPRLYALVGLSYDLD